MRRKLAALAAAALAAVCGAALAQGDYPTKPVRLVVGFAAGGISDVLARALAVKLASGLGQPVIVDNKPGAGTTIAGEFVAKSAPDGYTIWLHDITTHAINASLYAKLPYDSLKDFTPITLVASTPLMLVIHPSTPVSNVSGLIALLKARPGYYSYGSWAPGRSSIFVRDAENRRRGPDAACTVQGQRVRHDGDPRRRSDLRAPTTAAGGRQRPRRQAPRARGDAPKRTAAAPVPTMIEAGLPGFEIVLYSGILGPAGMSPGAVQRLHAEFVRVVNDPDIRAVYEKIGADPITDSPEEFRAMIAGEIAKLGPVVRASGARIE
jgi:tripartite-type tricarboxylate transporter receptor subunit TctC